MKKRIFVLLVLLCFLSQFDVVKAQTQIYLPIILSNGEKMSGLALLEITDGTTTVNLLAKEKETGFHLLSWRPQIIQPKDGGIYQDSSIAPGRDLVFAVDGTANEIFNTRLNGDSQDDLIQAAQDLLRLLTKARNYSLTSWQDTPVYIKARASCETNTRYALIKNFTIQDMDNPYSQPFFSASEIVAMNNISIAVERGHWLGMAPGSGECINTSSVELWANKAIFEVAYSPNNDVLSLLQTNTGRIMAGETGNIFYSDDDGVNWALLTANPVGIVYSLVQLSSGRILAGEQGGVWYSDNNGANWNFNNFCTNSIIKIVQLKNGRILASETTLATKIWYSDDNGTTWNLAYDLPSTADAVWSFLQLSSGRILAGTWQRILYSDDNGLTWDTSIYISSSYIYSLIQLLSGRILASGANLVGTGLVISSTDNAETWGTNSLVPVTAIYKFLQDKDGVIWAGDNGQVWTGDGESWSVFTTVPEEENWDIIQTTSKKLFFGCGATAPPTSGDIFRYDLAKQNMGASNTCSNISYISNKQDVANLTHIYMDDGGVFSANLFPMVLPTTLFPAVPAVNDATYFGIDTTITNSGPFTSLVFDLSTVITYTTSYTITWEYWTGAAWAALTVKDGTNNGTGVFRASGVNSVHWTPPSNWAANAVNGVTAYWVRARVSALVGTMTPPVQQNRNIYSVVNGYIEIASTEVLGDIPALSQILAHNRSDLDGPGGSAPNLYENRLIVGLRSYDRGPTFQAYLNAADEQNPFGLTVSVGTNTTIGNDINAPTGRSATYNPAGVEAMATRVLFTFGPTIARDYYGRFHAFVRAYRDGGSSTDFTVRLQVTNGSGGVTYTTDTAQLATTSRFEVLDFGMIKIPVAGSLGLSELGDTSTIAVQASAANAAVNLIIYDLILIPTDEWAIDSNDKTNNTLSEVGKSGGFEKVLNIDSVTMPKFPIRSVVQRYGSNLITTIYNSITPGEAILQANAQQRLWFFAMTTSATGTSYSWLSQPEISHSIQLYKNQRYLSLRGDR